MRRKKGATFLPERYYLSRSLQPPFSENKHQYVIPSSGYLLSHRLHRFSFVLRTPNLTTTYTTYTTSNDDIVAKGRVVLVVIVVLVVVNPIFLSLIQDNPCPSVSIRCYKAICAICVTKKLLNYLAVPKYMLNFAAVFNCYTYGNID